MKRYLMFLLVIISSLFLVLACSDSSSDDSGDNSSNTGGTGGTGGSSGGNSETSDDDTSGGDTGSDYTTPNIDNLSSLVGTYEITYFYSSAMNGFIVISTDCDKNTEYVGSDASSCTESVDHYGQVTIEYTEGEGLKIKSKMQMAGDVLTEEIISGITVVSMGSDYNYTSYTVIPESAVTNGVINYNDAVIGTTGRNRIGTTSGENSTYSFTIEDDYTIVNNMTDKSVSIAEATVVVRFTKVSDEVVTLDPNTPYSEEVAGFTVTLSGDDYTETE